MSTNHTAPVALSVSDPDLATIIAGEETRQQDTIELIASENLVSTAVLAAQGSILTNKYAEGYPGKRYYGGCAEVDKAEDLARKRAQQVFKTDYAVNVQPHSGSQANQAAYLALGMVPGDRLLGMSLDCGGHLTHGHKMNFSGRDFQVASYGVDPVQNRIDYDALEKQALEFKPKVIVAGASNYSRILDFARFAAIAKACGAFLVVDMAHIAGLIATGLHPTPFGHADIVTTTTHKTLRGPRGGMVFAKSEEVGKKVNSLVFPGIQGGPLMHVIAAKAVALGEALRPDFTEYMTRVRDGAKAMAETFVALGWKVVSGGTDNHLLSLNVMSKANISGKEAEDLLHTVHITVNKNTIPHDPLPPMKASGIRIGTPAIMSRGFSVEEAAQVAKLIDRTFMGRKDPAAIAAVAAEALALCRKHPIYR